MFRVSFFSAAVLLLPAAAQADELWVGAYAHDVETPTSKLESEGGADVHIGWRGNGIEALRAIWAPAPYVFASVNTAGDTSFAAAGLSWRFGESVYLRPGIGIAVHDAPGNPGPGSDSKDFGSRVLFEPEIAAGWQATARLAIEASWVHLSHAQWFGDQNPGIDNFGVRLVYRLP